MSQSNLIQTDRFVLSETERSSIGHGIHHYEDPCAASIEALRIVRRQRGWVPNGAIPAVGEVLGVPASGVESVTTFYSQIFRQPVGHHVIRICSSMVCYTGGHESVVGEIQKQLDTGLDQITADGRSTPLLVCYLGNCDKAPALMTDDGTHGDARPDGVARLLRAYVRPSPPLVRPIAWRVRRKPIH